MASGFSVITKTNTNNNNISQNFPRIMPMSATSTACLGLAAFASAGEPPMPGTYQMTLSWIDVRNPSKPQTFEHNRWYDLENQLYRDDTIQGTEVTETIVERPGQDKRKYDWDKVRGLCTNSTFQSRIEGFVPVYPGMDVAADTVQGVKATKYTKNLLQYNVSVWFSKGDSKVADGIPLQVYNSYDAEQKTHAQGITKITNFKAKVEKDDFKLSDKCEIGAVTPAPTPVVPTPSPADQPHWLRDWSRTDCGCKKVSWTGDFKTEDLCMKTECPHDGAANLRGKQ